MRQFGVIGEGNESVSLCLARPLTGIPLIGRPLSPSLAGNFDGCDGAIVDEIIGGYGMRVLGLPEGLRQLG